MMKNSFDDRTSLSPDELIVIDTLKEAIDSILLDNDNMYNVIRDIALRRSDGNFDSSMVDFATLRNHPAIKRAMTELYDFVVSKLIEYEDERTDEF